MFCKVVLCLSTLHLYSVAAQGECTDLKGRLIANGLHYLPGPDTCTLCVCDNGVPKVCKAVLCSPPQDCRSFRVGNTCCEFICLDDVVKPAEGAEANVRVAAGGAVAIVLLTVALVVYRVRKQKRRRPPHTEDQRSLTSIGYISGSMSYMGGNYENAPLGAWKPPSNYLPRGEAPPPYEEAMAHCRPETMRISNETSFHRTFAAAVDTRDDVCASHAYVNLPRPIAQIANTQNCYNAPLLQSVHPPEVRDATVIPYPLAQSSTARSRASRRRWTRRRWRRWASRARTARWRARCGARSTGPTRRATAASAWRPAAACRATSTSPPPSPASRPARPSRPSRPSPPSRPSRRRRSLCARRARLSRNPMTRVNSRCDQWADRALTARNRILNQSSPRRLRRSHSPLISHRAYAAMRVTHAQRTLTITGASARTVTLLITIRVALQWAILRTGRTGSTRYPILIQNPKKNETNFTDVQTSIEKQPFEETKNYRTITYYLCS